MWPLQGVCNRALGARAATNPLCDTPPKWASIPPKAEVPILHGHWASMYRSILMVDARYSVSEGWFLVSMRIMLLKELWPQHCSSIRPATSCKLNAGH